MEPYWIIIAPLATALAAPGIIRAAGNRAGGALLSLVPFALAAWLLAQGTAPEAVSAWSRPWLPSLGVDLAIRVGGFERLFLFLVSFIGGLVLIYGGSYFGDDPKAVRYFVVVLLFMAAMLGVVAADDLILLFVFWELTSITSFLLIGYKHEEEKARKSALQALLVTGAGGLALLAGLLLLAQITGETRISALGGQGAVIAASPLYVPAVLLVFLGAFTKSAQVPFHFWLPGAMAAPTPVSAYLHSATMVKAGVILLAKLHPALAATWLWHGLLVPVGLATMLTGALMAVFKTDLKQLLAYTTVSVLGALVMLLGFGDPYAVKTAMFLALAHCFYKGALFMIAGAVDHATGTRDTTTLSGLARGMPWLAGAAVVAALSMSGAPPTLGFMSKELLYQAKLSQPVAAWAISVLGIAASALGVTVALMVGVRPFFGPAGNLPQLHPPGPGMVAPPVLLAMLGLTLGLLPGWLDAHLISPAAAALGVDATAAELTLWHGFTLVLGLSVLTLLAGCGVFAVRRRLAAWPARCRALAPLAPSALYQRALDGLLGTGAWVTRTLQDGHLRKYTRTILLATSGLVAYAMLGVQWSLPETWGRAPDAFGWVVLTVMVVCALFALRSRSRLEALLCLGGVGFAVTMIFVLYGAPDLAITQLLVETLTVVLFSFVVLKLPPIRPSLPGRKRRRWDALAATLAGLVMTLLVWKAVVVDVHAPISPELVERSLTQAHGRNVVNVILVDFRVLDTLGEAFVLCLAAIGVVSLLHRARRPRPPGAAPASPTAIETV